MAARTPRGRATPLDNPLDRLDDARRRLLADYMRRLDPNRPGVPLPADVARPAGDLPTATVQSSTDPSPAAIVDAAAVPASSVVKVRTADGPTAADADAGRAKASAGTTADRRPGRSGFGLHDDVAKRLTADAIDAVTAAESANEPVSNLAADAPELATTLPRPTAIASPSAGEAVPFTRPTAIKSPPMAEAVAITTATPPTMGADAQAALIGKHSAADRGGAADSPLADSRTPTVTDASSVDAPFDVPPAVAALGLAPRMAQTLLGLLAGRSEKQVALALDLSPHTVHTYVKQLHKRLGVSSRGELLARFIRPF